jgi:predicted enzyme related to lactoylglutathione lyase
VGPVFEISAKGTLVYLNGGYDLSVPLFKVEAAGGKILLPKTAIGNGMTIFKELDSKQNLTLVKSKSFDCGIVVLNYILKLN